MQSLDDLKQRDPDLYKKIPWFVPVIVFGIFGLFLLFAIPIAFYQWLPPKHYWKSEIAYCLLSLTSKMFLGLMIYLNVLRMGSFEEALALE
jgi:hypothetical protein